MNELAWFDAGLKAALGLLLTFIPLTSSRLFGLQRSGQRFWPRLCGLLLCGIATATVLPLIIPDVRGGLGPAGLISIDFLAATAMLGSLVLGDAAPDRRGRAAVLVLGLTFLLLAFLQVAHL